MVRLSADLHDEQSSRNTMDKRVAELRAEVCVFFSNSKTPI